VYYDIVGLWISLCALELQDLRSHLCDCLARFGLGVAANRALNLPREEDCENSPELCVENIPLVMNNASSWRFSDAHCKIFLAIMSLLAEARMQIHLQVLINIHISN
jgi:hypothetical protein